MRAAGLIDLLSPSNRVRPRLCGLTEAVLGQADDLFALLELYPPAFSPEGAKGPALDALAALCGTVRPSTAMDDEDFRELLRARIARLHWDGTNGTLAEKLKEAFPGRSVSIRDNMDGTVTLGTDGAPFCLPVSTLFPMPMGIRMNE
ncbi:MAG: DUF2612 domain-containing protein [Clostridium sp.]|nr:DUF2612 domain-containing protein [Clostridium sp.]